MPRSTEQTPATNTSGAQFRVTIRSRKVRRILRLERQADRQATRHQKATTRAELFGRRLAALRTEAQTLQAVLTGAQQAELARARAAATPDPEEA